MILWISIALSAAAILAIWLIGWFFAISLVIKLVLTAAVLLIGALVAGLILYLRYTAARDLEHSMLQQGQAQIASMRPDRREGVMELQNKMQQAIMALKKSKLGSRGGVSALYALPWYIIVGPPGAGKTTAIKHSGLVFPMDSAQSASSYRGVGGTRNCDWWFTNDAILLDTAGRYATETNDQDEWLTFLDLLKKHRPSRPINGLIVAISLADLAVSHDQGIDDVARRIRARVDEIATRIQMMVPIYVVLTKCDLVQGFVEFWDDLRKSERGQIWGMSFALNTTDDPRGAFEREFAGLVKTLHARALRSFRRERRVEMRQKIAEFPLEFAPLRHHVGVFLQALFQKNRFQETPILRGVYFTSGTQMGTPTARVVASMAQAFGMRGQNAAALRPQQTEAKSFFLTDVFQRVMFRDQSVAGRTEADRQRRFLTRGAFALAGVLLGACLVLPAFFTFLRNRELISSTRDIATRAESIKWGEGTSLKDGAPHLDAAQVRLKELDAWEEGSPPLNLRWGMYAGDDLDEGMRELYGAVLARAAVARTHTELESRLRAMDSGPVRTNENFSKDYDTLKLYLMMGEPEHMNAEWAAPRLVHEWALTAHTRVPNEEDLLLPHVAYYFELLKKKAIKPWGIDGPVVGKARSILAQVPQVERLYESLVRDANVEIAPVRRETIFYGSVAPFIQSKRGAKVDGAYTKNGWLRVRDLLGVQREKLAAEKWVLQEGDAGAEDQAIAKLRELYFERYKNSWRDFLADLQVQDPGNSDLALDEVSALSEPEWPYLRLMRVMRENIMLDMSEPDASTDGGIIDKIKAAAEKKADEKAKQVVDGGIGLGGAAKKAAAGPSPVEVAFRPMLRFGLPAGEVPEGSLPPPTGLSQYQALLAGLVAALTDLRDNEQQADPRAATAKFQDATRQTTQLLTEQDGFTRPLLSPLLLNPIQLAANVVVGGSGQIAGGQWETEVWQAKWQPKLMGHYPFSSSGPDAPLADFVEFFRPGDGALWGFYDATLKSMIDHSGNKFSASRRLRSAVPFEGEFMSNCLSRGWDITETVFPKGTDAKVEPAVVFDVNLHSVSEKVAEVYFEVEGVNRTYRNEPERWLTVTWPGKGAHGAKLRVRGEGLNEEIGRQGDFGLFHLLDAAEIKQGTVGDKAVLIATFDIRGTKPPAQVKLDIKPAREQNPLQGGFFRSYQCPRRIVGR